MQKPGRKKVLIFSIVAITIFSFLTVYELDKSSLYFEKISGNKIKFSTFSIGERGGRYGISYAKEEYILINDNVDWKDFLNRTYHSPKQITSINESEFYILLDQVQLNFSENKYFGAFWGYKSNGGYYLEIKDLVLDGRNLNVYIERSYPGEMASAVITFPHHIIAINKEDIPSNVTVVVKFQEEDNFYVIPLICLIAMIIISITFFKITQKHKNGEQIKSPPTTSNEKK